MRIAIKDDVRLALTTLGRAKWRSGLTMLGVIIGVMSVILIVGIGEGARQQVADQITNINDDSLLVTAQIKDDSKSILQNSSAGGLLQVADVAALREAKSITSVTPVAHVSSPIIVDGKKNTAPVWATTSDFEQVFNKKMRYGGVFSDSPDATQGAVIGSAAAQQLFGQDSPLGRSFTVLDQTFVVYGVLDEVTNLPWVRGINFNESVILPYDVVSFITKNTVQPSEIYVTVNDDSDMTQAKEVIASTLEKNRGGQQDFQILTHDEVKAGADDTLSIITLAIVGIAAISLLVGGVGIMNVMFVSVSERIHEIGLRKAVGATNQQILRQFMTEALVVSFMGGLIGALLAVGACLLLQVYTNLDPVINVGVILLALAVTVVVGVVFGTIPALKAARKDPIEALRHE